MPQQVAGFAARIDDEGQQEPLQLYGHGLGELGLADPRLAAHEQRPAGAQGGVDGVDLAAAEDVYALRLGVAARLQGDRVAVFDGKVLHGGGASGP